MRIAYHFVIPEPPRLELDGAVQEALWLRERFGGLISFTYPFKRFSKWIPASLCGLRSIRSLSELDRTMDLHHLFTPGLPSYPLLGRVLTRPCVCTVQTSQGAGAARSLATLRPKANRLVVSDPRDVASVERATRIPTTWIGPGVDTRRFRRTQPPAQDGFTLLVGSAPWTRRQFTTKGVDQLVAAARRLPDLRLVFLWRGVLGRELAARIDRAGIADRTEVITEAVDVSRLLERVHAVVVLASTPKLIKAYPHSALEALAAGRPVLTSAPLALGGLVGRLGAGMALDSLSESAVLAGLRAFMEDYPRLANAAMTADLSEFSRARFLDAYGGLYDQALADS